MALYFYKALSKDGKRVSGQLDGTSVNNAKEQLVARGLYPTEVLSAQERAASSWWRSLFIKGFKLKQKIYFTNQLIVLLKAGIPLLQALELLTDQFSGSLRQMLIAIKDDVKQGTSFAQAIAQYPKSFDSIYVQLVRAGEASGKLEVVLERLVAYLERKQETSKRIKDALMMPIIQLVIAVIVTGVMLYFVVPQMAETFTKMGTKLPAITEFVMKISNGLRSYFLPILLVIGAVIGIFFYWKSTPNGKYALDVIKLKIPGVSYFVRMNAVVQFCYTLGLLLQNGVNLAEALDIVVRIVNNQILAQTLSQARDKIIKQGKISAYLKQTELFPPMAIYLINTGEQSGELDTMLLNVARNYEGELIGWTDSLTALINPIMLVFMALIVGSIIAAIMLPTFSVMDNIK